MGGPMASGAPSRRASMKVSDLIARLSQEPPDAEIMLTARGYYDLCIVEVDPATKQNPDDDFDTVWIDLEPYDHAVTL